MSLTKKIDFTIVFSVKKANPNGDPLNGNRPRVDYEGFGEVSDVCLKRKLRNRLQDMGESIFVQSDSNRTDDFRSLKERYDANEDIKTIITAAKKESKNKQSTSKLIALAACKAWYDVRAFGQVFAFESEKDSDNNSDSTSIGVRGPVSIQSAVSIMPVDVFSQQITKSVNLTTQKNPDKKASDTMGMKHRVEYGVYVSNGSINCQLAEKTGFSDGDAENLLKALNSLFVNDESAARPSGSMKVEYVIWWQHNCKNGQYASADVHDSIQIELDTNSKKPKVEIVNTLKGLEPEIFHDEK